MAWLRKLQPMEGSILALLEEQGSLGYEQIASQLEERPLEVRVKLAHLRDSGLVEVVSVGELVGHRTDAAAYWQLSDVGRAALARRRST